MGFLIRQNLRLFRASGLTWTTLALLELLVCSLADGHSAPVPGWFPASALVLACALGARSTAGAHGADAETWLRSLPILPGRLFLTRAFTAVVVWAALVALYYGCAWGIELTWFPTSLVEYSSEDLLGGALLCGLAFLASAYLAAAFEHAQASLEAGVAGFFSLISWSVLFKANGDAWPWLILAAVSGLVGVLVLVRRRGIGGASRHERLCGDLSRRELLLTLPAHAAFVLVPIVFSLHSLLGVPGRLLAGPVRGPQFVPWFVLGIFFLPWAWRDTERRGWRGTKRLGALLLVCTGIGLWVWRWIRPRGEWIECLSCRASWLDRAVRCPSCGREASWAVRRSPLFHALPRTPLRVLLYGVSGLFLLAILLRDQHFVHVLSVRSTLPGVELRILEEGQDRGTEIWRLAWPGSDWPGAGSGLFHRRKQGDARPADLTLSELARLGDGASHLEEILQPLLNLAVPLHIQAQYLEEPCVLEGFSMRTSVVNFCAQYELTLSLRSPQIESRLDELLAVLPGDDYPEALLHRAENAGDALFVALWQRWELRSDLENHRLVQALVQRRYSSASPDAEAVFQHADSLLREFEWLLEQQRPFILYPYVYSDVAALTSMGASIVPDLRARIREGDLVAILAAGRARHAELFDELRLSFRRQLRLHGEEAVVAAWAMASIDPSRAATELRATQEKWLSRWEWDLRELIARLGLPETDELLGFVPHDRPASEASRSLESYPADMAAH